MSDRLVIELQDAELLAAVDRAIATMQDSGPLMEDIGAKLESNAELRFDSKTDPSGVPWAPLSPVTIETFYAEKYPGGIPGSLLERTRFLRNSLSHGAGADFVDIGTSRAVPGRSQAEWQVGMLMETGTTKMPRRGILTADPKTGQLGAGDEADVLAIVSGYLGAAFR